MSIIIVQFDLLCNYYEIYSYLLCRLVNTFYSQLPRNNFKNLFRRLFFIRQVLKLSV